MSLEFIEYKPKSDPYIHPAAVYQAIVSVIDTDGESSLFQHHRTDGIAIAKRERILHSHILSREPYTPVP